ncbi:MAG: hypothetical protein AAB865_00530 [Patescibacteria group bacterium]
MAFVEPVPSDSGVSYATDGVMDLVVQEPARVEVDLVLEPPAVTTRLRRKPPVGVSGGVMDLVPGFRTGGPER